MTNQIRLSAIAGVLTPTLCLAWGTDGHRIVGEIASYYLTPEAEEAVKFLLGNQTLADASTWADEIKSDRSGTGPKIPIRRANRGSTPVQARTMVILRPTGCS